MKLLKERPLAEEKASPLEEVIERRKEEVRSFCDSLAETYDTWHSKNRYYYREIESFCAEIISPGSRVLEVGCGTGDLLNRVASERGVGIDISSEMIKRAQSKFVHEPHLYFTNSWEDPQIRQGTYDFIISADVVEHLEDVPGTFRYLRGLCGEQTTLIVSMANPAWEPILMILEKLNLKMPEGPHQRISFSALRDILDQTGFRVEEEGTRVLIPTAALPLADFINSRFYSSRFLRKFGLIGYLVAKPRT